MMESVRTSETAVYFNETTRHYVPEGCHLRTRRRENLQSRIQKCYLQIRSKGKAVPLDAMEALGGRGGIASTHSQPRH
jgi:hypothetical protein